MSFWLVFVVEIDLQRICCRLWYRYIFFKQEIIQLIQVRSTTVKRPGDTFLQVFHSESPIGGLSLSTTSNIKCKCYFQIKSTSIYTNFGVISTYVVTCELWTEDLEGEMFCMINYWISFYYLKKSNSQKLYRKLHRPGIEPGPPAWQASILPLNHRCLYNLT